MAEPFEVRGAQAVLYDSTDWHIPPREILIESPRGCGKTLARMRQVIGFCRRWPGSRHLLCRKTRESMTESTLSHFERLLPGHPEVLRVKRIQRHSYELFGSEVVAMGLDNPKTFGTEWDTVTCDEAFEATLDEWEGLGAVMRHFKMPFQQRVALTNPWHPNHWINQRAHPCPDSLRDVRTRADYARLDTFNSGKQGRMRRLVGVFQDNPRYWDADKWCYTREGESYVLGELATLSGHRRARLFQGRWVAAEGSVFGAEFDERRNTCEPFRVPSTWPVWFYLDPGYDHPCGAFWLTMTPTGKRIVVAEIYEREMDSAKIVGRIRQTEAELGLKPVMRFMDPNAGWSKAGINDGVALIERYQAFGMYFSKWAILRGRDKDAGVDAVRKALVDGALMVSKACPNALMELQSWSYKRNPKGERPAGDDQYQDTMNDILDGLIGAEVRGHRFDEICPPVPTQPLILTDSTGATFRVDDEPED